MYIKHVAQELEAAIQNGLFSQVPQPPRKQSKVTHSMCKSYSRHDNIVITLT